MFTRSLIKRSYIGFIIVPQQKAVVIQRLGRYNKTLKSGFHILIPIVDRAAYYHSLKQEVYPVNTQMAITKDNVTIHIDGVLYLKINDPYKASYGVGDPVQAMRQIAQTTMRSQLGKLTLDRTFQQRDTLNHAIVNAINEAATQWGIACMRYEIRDITPPPNIRKAMELQAQAERQKRADVLTSEGKRQADINIAEGERQSAILKAEGEAQAILAKANATSEGIKLLAEGIRMKGGQNAVQLRLAEQYVQNFAELAKSSQSMIVPSGDGDFSVSIAKALGIYKHMDVQTGSMKQEKKTIFVDPILESTDENN